MQIKYPTKNDDWVFHPGKVVSGRSTDTNMRHGQGKWWTTKFNSDAYLRGYLQVVIILIRPAFSSIKLLDDSFIMYQIIH